MISTYWKQFLEVLTIHRKISIAAAVVVVALLVLLIVFVFRAGERNLQVEVASHSEINHEDGRTVFSLTSQGEYLYKSKSKNGKEAVIEFLKTNPSFNAMQPLFPENFADSASINREVKDANDTFLTSNNFALTNEHYFFDQTINGIPVYNAQVAVHLRNANEIYAVSGNISNSERVTQEELSESEAMQVAIDQAQEESGAEELVVKQTKKFYVNERLLGISDDSTNKIALKVEVESTGVPVLFRTDYIVSLTTGEILYTESQTRDALSRDIYNCSGRSCSLARREGDLAVSDSDVNNLYTYFGNIYDFFANTFGRDSYDGNGATFNGYVHAPTGFSIKGATMKCPNAFWNGYEMVFCSGLVLLDVAAHELTHAITSRTAGLQYMRQSGALNESISDIFGSALDNNWEIGEGLSPGIGLPVPLRSMSNPPSQGNPDRLSSPLYHCGTSDNGGVHKNSGVFNKTYFLMTDGGSYNGCSINGIGRDKSIKITYQALTKYLTPTSNFKDAYTSILQACADLFGASSPECQNVDRAMQATELDQQSTSSVISPICQGVALKPATCAASGGAPTVAPTTPGPITGTVPTTSPSGPSPTPVESRSGTWFVKATPVCVGGKPNIKYDYEIPTGERGVIETLNDLGNPDGLEDWNMAFGGAYLVGKGTYITSGNAGPTILGGLKENYNYTVELHTGAPDPIPGSLILTFKVKTFDCSVSVPVPTTPGTPNLTPTPTPRQMFTCQPDPKCVQGKKNIQLCPLVCEPISVNPSVPTPTSKLPAVTSAPGTNPTLGPTSTGPTVTLAASTPTTAPSSVQAVINSVNEQKIREYLSNLVGKSSPGDNQQARYSCAPGNAEEREYIKSHFSSLGLIVEEQSISVGGCTTKNVIGRYEGKNKNSVYMITAHMDSVADRSGTNNPSPGADDNGSGTSAVMEIARVIAQGKPILEHSVEFVLFSGEEQGLYGSKYYANNIGAKVIKGLMNLDMVGISSGGNACVDFAYGSGGLGSAYTARAVDTNNRYSIGLTARSVEAVIPYSDHWPFQAKGKQAAFAYECVIDSTIASSIYHSLNDKIENINFNQIAKTAQAVAGATVDLADE